MNYSNPYTTEPIPQNIVLEVKEEIINLKKENDYIINRIQNILQYNITDFNVIARKILISEIKASTQDFSKYGFVHRDYAADDPQWQEPLLAGMLYFDQSYDGGTAFFHNQMDQFGFLKGLH